jgi:hypothetical protein
LSTKNNNVVRHNWATIGTPGTFRQIDKHSLVCDESYQRTWTESKALDIARDWAWWALGAISVAQRADGKYYVFDGQHRVLAAKKREDVGLLPCLVFEMDSVQLEALAFLRSNSARKPVNAVQKFKALTVTEDAAALLIKSLADSAGRVVSSGSGPTTVACVSSMRWMIGTDEAALVRIWPVVAEVCKGAALHHRLLEAMFFIERRMPNGSSLSDKVWRQRLLQIGADELCQSIYKSTVYNEKGSVKIYADGVLKAINKGRRNLLELSAVVGADEGGKRAHRGEGSVR